MEQQHSFLLVGASFALYVLLYSLAGFELTVLMGLAMITGRVFGAMGGTQRGDRTREHHTSWRLPL
jgi:hypothetical protein